MLNFLGTLSIISLTITIILITVVIKLIIAVFRIKENTADTADLLEGIQKQLHEIIMTLNHRP